MFYYQIDPAQTGSDRLPDSHLTTRPVGGEWGLKGGEGCSLRGRIGQPSASGDWGLTMKILDPTRIQHDRGESLSALLRGHADAVLRQGKTQAQIAGDSWLDESYVSRLLSGERENPSRDALPLLAGWGLGLPVEETDELLVAADYKPLILLSSR